MIVEFNKLKEEFKRVLIKYEVEEDIAEEISQVLAENDLDGVHTHGSIRFIDFIENDIGKKRVNFNNRPELAASFGAYEVVDGKGGLGILNAKYATDRAMDLAEKYGIGLVALKNTNHWMRGGSYAWQAADQGYALMAWTNTRPNMKPWGGDENKLGNSPIVVGVPRENGEHVVVDMALTQYSYGKIEENYLKGEELKVYGGRNKAGELTKDPAEIMESLDLLPTGYWKGSSLSFAIDMLGVFLSEGKSVEEIGRQPGNHNITQIFIAMDSRENVNIEKINKIMNNSLKDLKSNDNIDIRYPGERVIKDRKKNLEEGIFIHDEIWEKIGRL